MSLFGTLRKKKVRKSQVVDDPILDSQSEESKNFHQSTPNLHQLSNLTHDSVDFDYEKNPRERFKMFEHEKGENMAKNECETGMCSPSTVSLTQSEINYGPNFEHKVEDLSRTKSFLSLSSIAIGLKKSKSIRRKALASNLKVPEKTSSFYFIPSSSSNSSTSLNKSDEIKNSINLNSHNLPILSSPPTVRKGSIKTSSSLPTISPPPQKNNQSSSQSCSMLQNTSITHENNISEMMKTNTNSESKSMSDSLLNDSNTSINSSVSEEGKYFDKSVNLSNKSIDMERRKLFLQGAKKFNSDPKKGIEFLVQNQLIENTPESVAQFLKDGEGLSKSAIGSYLGEHHEFNLSVLSSFVELHDFRDVILVQALRSFLWSFRLPGEAQKIDRMMESFAKRYTLCNPGLFTNSDTCYLLSFAIIMLNTSLHNPNVKDKPTLEQFISMNRDIDAGQPLDRKFMTSLYNSIQTEPFQIPPEDGNDLMLTFFNPEIEGWLWKQGGGYKRWKRRWFILSNNCLYYFLFTTDKDPRGIIPLENIRVRKSSEKTGREFGFTLYKESGKGRLHHDYIKSCKASDGKLTAGKHAEYHLATKSKTDRERWISAINQNSSVHNFYTLLAEKKSRLEEAKNPKNTLRRQKSPPNPSTQLSPGLYRKSQISLPLTRQDAIRKSLLLQAKLMDLEPIPIGRSPIHYFNSANDYSTTSSLSLNTTPLYQNDEKIGRRMSAEESSNVEKIEEAKNNKKRPGVVRKFSLPIGSKLRDKLEYITSSGIRISVEDADNFNYEKNEEMPENSEEIFENTEEIDENRENEENSSSSSTNEEESENHYQNENVENFEKNEVHDLASENFTIESAPSLNSIKEDEDVNPKLEETIALKNSNDYSSSENNDENINEMPENLDQGLNSTLFNTVSEKIGQNSILDDFSNENQESDIDGDLNLDKLENAKVIEEILKTTPISGENGEKLEKSAEDSEIKSVIESRMTNQCLDSSFKSQYRRSQRTKKIKTVKGVEVDRETRIEEVSEILGDFSNSEKSEEIHESHENSENLSDSTYTQDNIGEKDLVETNSLKVVDNLASESISEESKINESEEIVKNVPEKKSKSVTFSIVGDSFV